MADGSNPIEEISIVITGDASAGEKQLDSIISRLKSVEESAEKANKRFAELFSGGAKSGSLEKTATVLDGILKTVETINSKTIAIKCDPSKAVSAARTVQQAFQNLSKQAGTMNVSVNASSVQRTAQSVQQEFDNLGKGGAGVAGAATALSNTKKEIKQTSSALASLKNNIKSVISPWKTLVSSIGRIAFYRAIRTALKSVTQAFAEGIKNAYLFSKARDGALSKNLDNLATSALYLKNTLGALAAPLINAVAPAIEWLVDKMVNLINLVTEFIAKLSGQSTWMRAVRYATQFNAQTQSAAGHVKEIRATLLGIDEINRLDAPTSGGSGGGGGSTMNPASMFVEEQTSPMTSLQLKIKDLFFNWDDLNPEQVVEKGATGLFSLLGTAAGFAIGGLPGAFIGAIGGGTLGLHFVDAKFNGDGKISESEGLGMFSTVLNAMLGGVIGFKLGKGKGGLVGTLAGVVGDVAFEKLHFEGVETLKPDESSSDKLINRLSYLLFDGLGFAIGLTFGPKGALLGASIGDGLRKVADKVGWLNVASDWVTRLTDGMKEKLQKADWFNKDDMFITAAVKVAIVEAKEQINNFTDWAKQVFGLKDGNVNAEDRYAEIIPGVNAPGWSIEDERLGRESLWSKFVNPITFFVNVEESGTTPHAMETLERASDLSKTIPSQWDKIKNLVFGVSGKDTTKKDLANAEHAYKTYITTTRTLTAAGKDLANTAMQNARSIWKTIVTRKSVITAAGKDIAKATMANALQIWPALNTKTARLTATAEDKTGGKIGTVAAQMGELHKKPTASLTVKGSVTFNPTSSQVYDQARKDGRRYSDVLCDGALAELTARKSSLWPSAKALFASPDGKGYATRGAEIAAAVVKGAKNGLAKGALYPQTYSVFSSPSGTEYNLRGDSIGKAVLTGITKTMPKGALATTTSLLFSSSDGKGYEQKGKSISTSVLVGAGAKMATAAGSLAVRTAMMFAKSDSDVEDIGGSIANSIKAGAKKNMVASSLFSSAKAMFSSVNAPENYSGFGGKIADSLKAGVPSHMKPSTFFTTVRNMFSQTAASDKYDSFGGRVAKLVTSGIEAALPAKSSFFETIKAAFKEKSSSDGFKEIGKGIGVAVSTGIADKLKLTVSATTGGKVNITTAELKAAGGFVDRGELFVAKEAGPEMVGRIGTRSAVANTQQIVTGIADGVYEGNVEQNALLEKIYEALVAFKNQGSSNNNGGMTPADITRYNRRVGTTVIPVCT